MSRRARSEARPPRSTLLTSCRSGASRAISSAMTRRRASPLKHYINMSLNSSIRADRLRGRVLPCLRPLHGLQRSSNTSAHQVQVGAGAPRQGYERQGRAAQGTGSSAKARPVALARVNAGLRL
jgi:hypothetical protein